MRTSTRTALLVLVAASAVACKKQGAAEASSGAMAFEWSQRSADGKVELRQHRETTGKDNTNVCRVQALSKPDDKVLWSGSACLPTPSGLVFIAKGGEKLLVLDLFPGGTAVQSPDWSQVSLAQLWNKGIVVRQYKGVEILAGDRAADMRRSLSWLRGETYEEVRSAARAVSGESQVSADLADGRTVTFGFEGAPLPTPPAVSAPPPAAAEPAPQPAAVAQPEAATVPVRTAEPGGLSDNELYRWTDEHGSQVFGYGSDVPPRFRKSARPVQGSIGIVPNETPTPLNSVGQPVAQQPGQPGQPAASATAQPAPAQPAAPRLK